MGFKYLKRDEKRIKKEQEKLDEKYAELLNQAEIEKLEKRHDELERKGEAMNFKEKILLETYEEITPEYLRQRGIRLLLSDLDYTLAPKYVPHPDDRVREWLRRMEEGGVQVMILSNNRSSHRVETFCRELGIPYVGHAQKPRTTGFHRAMEQAGVTAAETAMMGDKLLTDMLGANLAGVLALMVEPAGGPKGAWNWVLHALQAPFKAVCRRRHT